MSNDYQTKKDMDDLLMKIHEEKDKRMKEDMKGLNRALDEMVASRRSVIPATWESLHTQKNSEAQEDMRKEIEEAKAKAEAEIRAKYRQNNPGREWAESDGDKALRNFVRGLK